MYRKAWAFSLLILILAASLSACERSYSKSPVTAPTSGDLPFPTPITGNAVENILAGTQTAVAAAHGSTADLPFPVATGTAAPLAATATRVPPTPTITPTFAVIASATPGMPSTYIIHQGEWPFCLARRFNIDPAELLAANNLDVNSRPEPGSSLVIPQDAARSAAGSRSLLDHPALYTVQDGDTIYSIACKFGDADPNAIILANNLKDPYTLAAGSTIQVP